MNYAPNTPRDKGGMPKDGYPPAKTALVSTNKEDATNSSILLLGHDTTELEIAAVNQHIAGKWLTQATIDSSVAGTSVITAVGTANFDFMVQTDTVRSVVVPVSAHVADYGSVQGVNRAMGLYPAVAYKTFAGAGSVLTIER